MYTNTRIVVMGALLALAFIPSAHATDPTPPDLCVEPLRGVTGEAYVDLQGDFVSRFCDPRINPPVLDLEVCCSIGETASCKLPDAVGRCSTGMKFWCEYGVVAGTTVACFQPGPGTCAEGHCSGVPGPGTIFDDSSWVCCSDDDECVYVGESGDNPPENVSCAGDLTICNWGSLNEDNTVTCGNSNP